MKRLAFVVLVFAHFQLAAQELPALDWEELGKIHPWTYTEINKEIAIVKPGDNTQPPSDAIVLFNGKDLNEWQKTPFGEGVLMDRTELFLKNYKAQPDGKSPDWTIDNGELVVPKDKGAIASKKSFGDMQLHVEWFVPVLEGKTGQAYGNSGIFLMGLYEIQVLNSYENETYSNGQAGSIYKQHSPMVNASRPPGTWQTYDILFSAPRFSESGNVVRPGQVTVIHNGIVVQYNSILQGPTVFIGEPYYVAHPDKLPIVLQDHANPVRYRNIWVREL